ncbi:unnamed protein product [Parnassius apollo]|uniref:(apollo) hypothetical protein n=1 Tax=Parnassius apollo TaxID=110799 RepID=A0A8S3XB28_PARAO|nr:unnamed protein product [Parnassius apollo]
MRSRLILLFLLNVSLLSCVEVNLHEHGTTITSKTKIELPPFLVKCKLNDIAILPSPAVNEHNVQYYLSKPNGKVIKLDLSDFRSDKLRFNGRANDIVKTVPGQPSFPRLKEGSNFTLSFAYPIKVETCELRPPRSASDRFYDRDKTRLDFCGYTVPNVTLNDEGLWKIIGVGNIVYETKVYLKVRNKNL